MKSSKTLGHPHQGQILSELNLIIKYGDRPKLRVDKETVDVHIPPGNSKLWPEPPSITLRGLAITLRPVQDNWKIDGRLKDSANGSCQFVIHVDDTRVTVSSIDATVENFSLTAPSIATRGIVRGRNLALYSADGSVRIEKAVHCNRLIAHGGKYNVRLTTESIVDCEHFTASGKKLVIDGKLFSKTKHIDLDVTVDQCHIGVDGAIGSKKENALNQKKRKEVLVDTIKGIIRGHISNFGTIVARKELQLEITGSILSLVNNTDDSAHRGYKAIKNLKRVGAPTDSSLQPTSSALLGAINEESPEKVAKLLERYVDPNETMVDQQSKNLITPAQTAIREWFKHLRDEAQRPDRPEKITTIKALFETMDWRRGIIKSQNLDLRIDGDVHDCAQMRATTSLKVTMTGTAVCEHDSIWSTGGITEITIGKNLVLYGQVKFNKAFIKVTEDVLCQSTAIVAVTDHAKVCSNNFRCSGQWFTDEALQLQLQGSAVFHHESFLFAGLLRMEAKQQCQIYGQWMLNEMDAYIGGSFLTGPQAAVKIENNGSVVCKHYRNENQLTVGKDMQIVTEKLEQAKAGVTQVAIQLIATVLADSDENWDGLTVTDSLLVKMTHRLNSHGLIKTKLATVHLFSETESQFVLSGEMSVDSGPLMVVVQKEKQPTLDNFNPHPGFIVRGILAASELRVVCNSIIENSGTIMAQSLLSILTIGINNGKGLLHAPNISLEYLCNPNTELSGKVSAPFNLLINAANATDFQLACTTPENEVLMLPQKQLLIKSSNFSKLRIPIQWSKSTQPTTTFIFDGQVIIDAAVSLASCKVKVISKESNNNTENATPSIVVTANGSLLIPRLNVTGAIEHVEFVMDGSTEVTQLHVDETVKTFLLKGTSLLQSLAYVMAKSGDLQFGTLTNFRTDDIDCQSATVLKDAVVTMDSIEREAVLLLSAQTINIAGTVNIKRKLYLSAADESKQPSVVVEGTIEGAVENASATLRVETLSVSGIIGKLQFCELVARGSLEVLPTGKFQAIENLEADAEWMTWKGEVSHCKKASLTGWGLLCTGRLNDAIDEIAVHSNLVFANIGQLGAPLMTFASPFIFNISLTGDAAAMGSNPNQGVLDIKSLVCLCSGSQMSAESIQNTSVLLFKFSTLTQAETPSKDQLENWKKTVEALNQNFTTRSSSASLGDIQRSIQSVSASTGRTEIELRDVVKLYAGTRDIVYKMNTSGIQTFDVPELVGKLMEANSYFQNISSIKERLLQVPKLARELYNKGIRKLKSLHEQFGFTGIKAADPTKKGVQESGMWAYHSGVMTTGAGYTAMFVESWVNDGTVSSSAGDIAISGSKLIKQSAAGRMLSAYGSVFMDAEDADVSNISAAKMLLLEVDKSLKANNILNAKLAKLTSKSGDVSLSRAKTDTVLLSGAKIDAQDVNAEELEAKAKGDIGLVGVKGGNIFASSEEGSISATGVKAKTLQAEAKQGAISASKVDVDSLIADAKNDVTLAKIKAKDLDAKSHEQAVRLTGKVAADKATLSGAATVQLEYAGGNADHEFDSLKLETKRMQKDELFKLLHGSGAFAAMKISDKLDLAVTDQAIVLGSINKPYDLSVTGKTVDVIGNVAAKNLAIRAKDGDVSVKKNASLAAKNDLTVKAKGHINMEAGSRASANQDVSMESEEKSITLTNAHVSGGRSVEMKAKQDINILAEKHHGQRAKASTVTGGAGKAYGDAGRKMGLRMDAGNNLNVKASKLKSDADNILTAEKDINILAETTDYSSTETKRSGFLGYKKTTTTTTWTEVDGSDIQSGGKNIMVAKSGGITSIASNINAAESNYLSARKDVKLLDIVTTRRATTNQSTWWGLRKSTEHDAQQLGHGSSLVSKGHDPSTIISKEGDILIEGSTVKAAGEMNLIAEQGKVQIKERILTDTKSREWSGLTIGIGSVGYRTEESSSTQDRLAGNSFSVGRLNVKAKQFHVENSMNFDVSDDMEIDAEDVKFTGAHLRSQSNEHSFEGSFSGLSMCLSFTEETSAKTASTYQNQIVSVGGKVTFKNVKNLAMHDANLSADEVTGDIENLDVTSNLSTSEETSKKNTLDYNFVMVSGLPVPIPGFDMSDSQTKSGHVDQISGIHARKSLRSSDLRIKKALLTGASITSDANIENVVEKVETKDVDEYLDHSANSWALSVNPQVNSYSAGYSKASHQRKGKVQATIASTSSAGKVAEKYHSAAINRNAQARRIVTEEHKSSVGVKVHVSQTGAMVKVNDVGGGLILDKGKIEANLSWTDFEAGFSYGEKDGASARFRMGETDVSAGYSLKDGGGHVKVKTSEFEYGVKGDKTGGSVTAKHGDVDISVAAGKDGGSVKTVIGGSGVSLGATKSGKIDLGAQHGGTAVALGSEKSGGYLRGSHEGAGFGVSKNRDGSTFSANAGDSRIDVNSNNNGKFSVGAVSGTTAVAFGATDSGNYAYLKHGDSGVGYSGNADGGDFSANMGQSHLNISGNRDGKLNINAGSGDTAINFSKQNGESSLSARHGDANLDLTAKDSGTAFHAGAGDFHLGVSGNSDGKLGIDAGAGKAAVKFGIDQSGSSLTATHGDAEFNLSKNSSGTTLGAKVGDNHFNVANRDGKFVMGAKSGKTAVKLGDDASGRFLSASHGEARIGYSMKASGSALDVGVGKSHLKVTDSNEKGLSMNAGYDETAVTFNANDAEHSLSVKHEGATVGYSTNASSGASLNLATGKTKVGINNSGNGHFAVNAEHSGMAIGATRNKNGATLHGRHGNATVDIAADKNNVTGQLKANGARFNAKSDKNGVQGNFEKGATTVTVHRNTRDGTGFRAKSGNTALDLQQSTRGAIGARLKHGNATVGLTASKSAGALAAKKGNVGVAAVNKKGADNRLDQAVVGCVSAIISKEIALPQVAGMDTKVSGLITSLLPEEMQYDNLGVNLLETVTTALPDTNILDNVAGTALDLCTEQLDATESRIESNTEWAGETGLVSRTDN
ncbi:uncharacterized protein LOC129583801 [Paramacrobiotus metropolitanus]|uniref:uncharacterized protein LOC129583801 n=1 Tax=Paramacrobiotus metropolitanus TaxID=2943436 RepID=UPI002446376E|nr:uncharacterized protein LOC129583801 [Paramacrobiotus metropolitanus]